MGWKSTITISRKEAIALVFKKLSEVHMSSDEELGDLLETLGYGDNTNLPYYGYNFLIGEDDSTL